MTWIKKHFWDIAPVLILFAVGFYFRIKGISSNHSFWSDEALPSSIARDILLGKTSFLDGINVLGYQRLQVMSDILSFKLFGLSEWAARIPSVLWGSLGIIFAYLLAKKHSNKGGGLLAAFLFTFMQLNLAHSTQAKPYAAIETLLLAVIYFVDNNILLATALAFLATLYNFIGVVAFIPVIIFLGKYYNELKKRPVILLVLFILSILLFWVLRIDQILSLLMRTNYNWMTYLRELFWRQYAFITLPAIFGLFFFFLYSSCRISTSVFVEFYLLQPQPTLSYARIRSYVGTIRYLLGKGRRNNFQKINLNMFLGRYIHLCRWQ
ncbi:MAG: hypothetical protein US50_C0036G0006 [Candidatus Nomurabacteria bacterium GW2011_GWB1_37_5]|uniref:Glycosyltransferase RgtA/B/C/D-like domain-containing protein n=1 Tax=Candidatus Nomurabacteria bacterium GW2011_GWB1_37_5 TaxID=1618742 RepID=A0A0G0K2D9_9BACT|nr:MAG: hypothetical protein US50_C0036G0006 [Candidatus Nomurabacteria bacterium GW2011_GWB1_37_5]